MKKMSRVKCEMQKKNMTFIRSVLCVSLCMLLFVGTIVLGDIRKKDIYAQTYYAALPGLYERLDGTANKKIVIIGNSSVPFGVDTALLEKLLIESGQDYTVCNFGLYGAIGTRAMLELALGTIGEGDIIVYMPEAVNQSQSLYFSATQMWKAVESDRGLLWKLGGELKSELLANYPMYIYEKNSVGAPVEVSDVYALGSFDGNMNMVNYDREYNIMDGGVDNNNPVALDAVLPDADYYEYVNTYYEKVKKRGATMLFMYGPMNEGAVSGDVSAYCERIKNGYAFPVVGDISQSIMAQEWFYDSNFHLNSSGMTVFTKLLADNLKNYFGDSSVTECSLPDMPQKDKLFAVISGDNSDEEYFVYEEYSDGYRIIGLTDKGKERGQLTVPVSHDGRSVAAISADTFSEAEKLKSIVFQENIKSLPDYMFTECRSLEKIKLIHSSPGDISVGYHLLAGTAAAVCVREDLKNTFKNNYFWGYYAEVIEGYE